MKKISFRAPHWLGVRVRIKVIGGVGSGLVPLHELLVLQRGCPC